MKKTTFILAPLILLLFYGCATTSITANKADWYNQRLSRVFIYLNTPKEAEKYSEKLAAGILSEFRQNRTEGESSIRNPLSLEPEAEILEKINEYKPHQLMFIQLTALETTNGILTGGNFEVTIIDNETEKIIWKAIIDAHGNYGLSTSIDQILDKLFIKLREDGLLLVL